MATTNDREPLRDRTGNRRFWVVPIDVRPRCKDLFRIPDAQVDQLWAEAVQMWKAGEALFLDREMELEAIRRQEEHTEEDPKAGMIREFLERPLPRTWSDMDLVQRRSWYHNRTGEEYEEGMVKRDRVCAAEIWAELLEGDPRMLTRAAASDIRTLLDATKGWKPGGKQRCGRAYGVQRVYLRSEGAE